MNFPEVRYHNFFFAFLPECSSGSIVAKVSMESSVIIGYWQIHASSRLSSSLDQLSLYAQLIRACLLFALYALLKKQRENYAIEC
jgi:hypothetical protein